MTIESPATYAEWYWKHNVDATQATNKALETELSALAKPIIDELINREGLPASVDALLSAISLPEGQALAQVGGRFVSEVADGVVGEALSPFLRSVRYASNSFFQSNRITSRDALTLFQRNKITDDLFEARMSAEGYQPTESQFLYDASLPYPDISEIIRYGRYHGDPDSIRDTVWKKFNLPVDDFDLWEWTTAQRLTTEQVHTMYRRGIITVEQYYNELARLGWSAEHRKTLEDIGWTVPNSMLLVQGGLMLDMPDDALIKEISIGDIHPRYAKAYLEGILTKPSTQDIIAYNLRLDPTLSDLDRHLRRIGIHPSYWPLYKELAYQIPPLADIITMAVREAFTPSVAARFGQYEDYPDQLTKWSEKKGLSEEWAKRYWAAHWSLPSPQQGFEMLHRGIITRDDLDLLLRASDVMPFWREKLVQIAYKPLTRVDVRRMYKEGVLDEDDVYQAYLDIGYNEENAERMALFTVRQTLSSMAKFSSTDVVNAYSKRMIDRSEARSILIDIGIRREDAEYILSTAEYKRQWAYTDSRIKAIKNLYSKEVYTENQARDELSKLDLPSDQINLLMDQWYSDKEAEPTNNWTTAQTLSFLKAELINKDRAIKELKLIGYDQEHIDTYLKSIV